MQTVLMHGPSISDPSKIVERDVPVVDVQVYTNAGYVKGPLPKDDGAGTSRTSSAITAAAPAKKATKRGK